MSLSPGFPSAMTASLAAGSTSGPRLDVGRPIRAGLLAFVLLGASVGGWAGTTSISGAVVAPGTAMVLGHAKVIQHPDGGTIASIAVENGDSVAKGDVLFTLDPTLVSLNLDIARTRLAAALALKARLEAERQGVTEIETLDFTPSGLPASVAARPLDLSVEAEGQREIFAARAAVLAGGRARLAEALVQYDEQITGAEAQRRATTAQAELLQEQIATQQSLVAQGLARTSQLSDLRRALADIDGRSAAFDAEIQQLQTAKRDAEIETEQTERAFREGVVTELRKVTGEIDELTLEIVTRQGELDRMVVRAPDAGIVHEMTLTTVGGVVQPGAVLMQIVPQDRGLAFEVQIAAGRDRPGAPGPGGRTGAVGLRPERDAAACGRGAHRLGRGGPRPAERTQFLPRRTGGDARGAGAARRAPGHARHAGRGLSRHRRSDRAVLPDPADRKPPAPRLPRIAGGAVRGCRRETPRDAGARLVRLPSGRPNLGAREAGRGRLRRRACLRGSSGPWRAAGCTRAKAVVEANTRRHAGRGSQARENSPTVNRGLPTPYGTRVVALSPCR